MGVGGQEGDYHQSLASPFRCHHTPSSKTSGHSGVCVRKMWAFWSISVVGDSWGMVMDQKKEHSNILSPLALASLPPSPGPLNVFPPWPCFLPPGVKKTFALLSFPSRYFPIVTGSEAISHLQIAHPTRKLGQRLQSHQ